MAGELVAGTESAVCAALASKPLPSNFEGCQMNWMAIASVLFIAGSTILLLLALGVLK